MRKEILLSFRIGAAFIGTVIGAGYASGQEIMQFFTVFGPYGFITVILSGLMFFIAANSILNISDQLKAYDYKDFVSKLCGKKIGFLYDSMITLFLFLGTSIMFSGSCEVFKAFFKIPKIAGILIICLLTLLAVFKSLEGLLNVNSIIVPVISSVVIFTSFMIFKDGNISLALDNMDANSNISAFKPFFFMLFYCSYNLILSLGVLSAFPKDIKNKNVLRLGAFIGGFGLMVLAFLLNSLIFMHMPQILDESMPMLYITKYFHPYFKYALALCIWGEIFSTAVSDVFSLGNRIAGKKKYSYKAICTLIVFLSIPLSLFDFKSLVAFFYPLFGALSMFLMVYIVFKGSGKHNIA
ncbi:YkvI family membrane protein [Lutispora thermophila]|uniref:Uncharacterized membrane protein YkvI n=1 Tax=Lutispora thermophila DSM 19022 TaxID=1122184 RepID=A0A1M6BR77_9FIRM|nr:GerAB/ArcD/ProY family transporter [Lutispora thermophila]SHI51206.1 Uncharacterized membrane protein YkvI [Lutispora thermophila DSM 19022]